MKLEEIKLTDNNHFIAMEYYGLILNRSYLVIFVENHMLGLICNGVVSSDVDANPGTYDRGTRKLIKAAVSPFVIAGDLDSPSSYINENNVRKYDGVDLLSENILDVHKRNFRYSWSDISSIRHDEKKKWGMGDYPHDGKIYITIEGRTRELIPLGRQSGKTIVANIERRLK